VISPDARRLRYFAMTLSGGLLLPSSGGYVTEDQLDRMSHDADRPVHRIRSTAELDQALDASRVARTTSHTLWISAELEEAVLRRRGGAG
jgi:hypothetical protein